MASTPISQAPGASGLREALEHEAHELASRELGRRQGLLRSLATPEREAVTALTQQLARDLVDGLVAEAQRDERLADALRSAVLVQAPIR